MNDLEKVINEMDFNYFGTGQHKMEVETFLASENAVLLDVRANEEVETIKMPLLHHVQVLEIPTNEVPQRISEMVFFVRQELEQ